MPLDSWTDSYDLGFLTVNELQGFVERTDLCEDIDISNELITLSEDLVVGLQGFTEKPATTSGEAGATTVYRLRGYFIGGATYEFWTGASTSTPNPSGNPLVGVVIDAVIS